MMEKIFKKRNQRLMKKIFASVMLPMFVFQMSSLNFLFLNVAYATEGEAPIVIEESQDAAGEKEIAPENPSEKSEELSEKEESSAEEEVISGEIESNNDSSPVKVKEVKDEEEIKKVQEATWDVQGKTATIAPVKTGKTYVAPQNKDVTVTFSKLPEKSGSLSIKEINLTKEQQELYGAISDKAYDITSDMKNGTFEYNLTLPKPENEDKVEVKFAENVEGLKKAEVVSNNDVEVKSGKVNVELNHMTVFVVTTNSPALTGMLCTDAGASDESDCYNNIQDAINAAKNNDTIQVKNGIYNLSSTLNISKSISIIGESEAGVIINASGASGYGITNNSKVNNITLKNFTLNNANTYGFKMTSTNDLEIKNVTVNGSGRSEVDLNTVNKATLENITANGNGTAGVGLALSNSTNVTLKNISTLDNAWGGVGLYDTSSGATKNVTFAGANSFSESWPIYIDEEYGHAVNNIDLPSDYDYAIRNTTFRDEVAKPNRSEAFTVFQNSEANAITTALAMQSAPFAINTDSYIQIVGNKAALDNVFIVGEGMSIKTAVTEASNNGKIYVRKGTFAENQITIDKNIAIIGDGKNDVLIRPAQNTGSAIHSDVSGWFLVNSGKTFDLSGVTLDGAGKNILVGIFSRGHGTIQDNIFSNIHYTKYFGIGIELYGSDMIIKNNEFSNIERIGVFNGNKTDSHIIGNKYVGKGDGDWLDYAFEVGRDSKADISENIISNNKGVAHNGSTSAGILVTSYFGSESSQATIIENTIYDCTDGIAVGYDNNDTSVVVAHKNKLGGNVNGVNSTKSLVDATDNWWGDATGPQDNISGDGSISETNPGGKGSTALGAIKYSPWYTDEAMEELTSPSAITKDATDISLYNAILNGTNGNYNATGHSFWVSLSPFETTSPNIPSGVYSTPDFGSISANADFSASLSLVTTQGIHSNMPAITPNTKYYYVAWSRVGNTWYPGEMKNFTTNPISAPILVSPADGIYRHTSDSNKSDWSDVSESLGSAKYYYESSLSRRTNSDGSFVTTAYKSDALTVSEIFNPGEPEVTYYWHVKACDEVGNCSAWSPAWQINIDNTVPTMPTINGFKNPDLSCGAVTNIKNITVDWSDSTDNTGVVGYDYHINYPLSNSSNRGDWNTFFTSSQYSGSLNEGVHNIEVRAKDAAGNVSEWSNVCSITYDSISPEFTLSGIKYSNGTVQDKYVTNWNTPVFVGELTSSDIALIKVTINNIDYPAVINGDEWTVAVTGALSDGSYNMQVVAIDNAGNSTQIEKELIIDTKTPSAVYQYYKDGQLITDQIAYVKNVNQLSFRGDYTDASPSSGLSTDSYVIFEAQDDGSFKFSQNGKKAYCGWRHAPNLLSLSGQTFSQTDSVSFTNCVAGLPDGEYYMAHQVADGATRKDIPSINQFKDVLGLHFVIDTNAPAVPGGNFIANDIEVSNNGFTNSERFTFNLSSSDETVRYQLKYWNDIPEDRYNGESNAWNPNNISGYSSSLGVYNDRFSRGEGVHHFKFSACDFAGNCSVYSEVFTVTYDKSIPELANKTNFSGWYNSKQVSTFQYVDDNMGGEYEDLTCEITSEGINQTCFVTPNICDSAGNCYTILTESNGANIDLTLPTSTINGGTDNEIIYLNSWDGKISGTASDNLSGVEKVKLSIQNGLNQYWNGAVWQADEFLVEAEGTTAWNYTLTPVIEDSYTIKSHALDKAGNMENTYTLTVVLDKTIPEVNLNINPGSANGKKGWYNTVPEIILTASDNINLDKIEYQIDSQAGNWLTYSATVKIQDGKHIFYYRSLDRAGNYSGVGIKNVKVDTHAPDKIKSLEVKYDGEKNTVKLEWRANDSDIDQVYVYRGTRKNFDTNSGSRIAKNNDNDKDVTDRNIVRGKKYYYKLVSVDEAGNKSDEKNISVEIPENGEDAVVTDEGTENTTTPPTQENNNTGENQGSNVEQGEDSGEKRVEGAMTTQKELPETQRRVWPYFWAVGIGILLLAGYWRRRKKEAMNLQEF